uniref:Uncharacterized protein n=1 Tax=Anopheles albimanus TaxID=7167 RepID=A0A182FY41_ANOAL
MAVTLSPGTLGMLSQNLQLCRYNRINFLTTFCSRYHKLAHTHSYTLTHVFKRDGFYTSARAHHCFKKGDCQIVNHSDTHDFKTDFRFSLFSAAFCFRFYLSLMLLLESLLLLINHYVAIPPQSNQHVFLPKEGQLAKYAARKG